MKKNRLDEDVTLGPDTRKSIIPALLSSANGTVGNSTSPLVESRSAIKEKKTRRDTLQDSTSKLLSSIKANSKGPYYKTSFNSDMKEQQQRNYESSKSSVKRSLLRGHENNDKSFLFYPHQNQPQHFSELLLKRYGNIYCYIQNWLIYIIIKYIWCVIYHYTKLFMTNDFKNHLKL